MKKDCRGRKICATCNCFHPSYLHKDSPEAAQHNLQNRTRKAISHRVNAWDSKSSHSLIVPVWLHQKEDPERKKMVYALLDDQSDACFVKDGILQQLNVTGPAVQLKLSTVQGESLITCMKISNLVVQGVNEQTEVLLPGTYSRAAIPAKRCQIPRPESVIGWSHLESLSHQLMPYRQDVEVGLLIGANCARAIKPREVIPGMDDDPYAMRIALGWGRIGNLSLKYSGQESEHCTCDQIISRENGAQASKTIGHFVLKTYVKEVHTPAKIGKLFDLDFNEAVRDDKGLSHLDRKFLNVLRSNIRHEEDGHYEVPYH